jgi:hypothetical protein
VGERATAHAAPFHNPRAALPTGERAVAPCYPLPQSISSKHESGENNKRKIKNQSITPENRESLRIGKRPASPSEENPVQVSPSAGEKTLHSAAERLARTGSTWVLGPVVEEDRRSTPRSLRQSRASNRKGWSSERSRWRF